MVTENALIRYETDPDYHAMVKFILSNMVDYNYNKEDMINIMTLAFLEYDNWKESDDKQSETKYFWVPEFIKIDGDYISIDNKITSDIHEAMSFDTEEDCRIFCSQWSEINPRYAIEPVEHSIG